MKLRMSLALGVAVTGLMISTAAPASADDTTTTFALTGGALSFSVPPSATLADRDTGTPTITGSLGPVSVTDNRGGLAPWIASATSTPFTGVRGSASTAVSYTAGTVTETGTITVADGAATTLTATAANVVAPTTVSGNNTASWTPTLEVSMPTSALADAYTGTVTTSVA
jgi:hypothetical protein